MSHALPRILPVYSQISCHIWLKRSTAPVYLRLACHIWLSIFLPSSPHTCVFVYSGVLSSWQRKVWLQSGVNFTSFEKVSVASRVSQGSIVSLGSPEFTSERTHLPIFCLCLCLCWHWPLSTSQVGWMMTTIMLIHLFPTEASLALVYIKDKLCWQAVIHFT